MSELTPDEVNTRKDKKKNDWHNHNAKMYTQQRMFIFTSISNIKQKISEGCGGLVE